MSLLFQHGIVNARWNKEVDIVLGKKRGVRKTHQISLSGILEADDNTSLKIVFSHRLMVYAETCGLNDELLLLQERC